MRISDWSSDVCSSDLPNFEQRDHRGNTAPVERVESGIGDIIAAIGEPAARRIDIGCIDIGRRARIAGARTDGDEVNGPFGKGANREGREIALAEAAIRTEPAFGVV